MVIKSPNGFVRTVVVVGYLVWIGVLVALFVALFVDRSRLDWLWQNRLAIALGTLLAATFLRPFIASFVGGRRLNALHELALVLAVVLVVSQLLQGLLLDLSLIHI